MSRNVTEETSEKFQVSCDNSTDNTTRKCGRNVTIQETEVDVMSQVTSRPPCRGGWTLNLWMLQLRVKMSLGINVTVDQKYSGCSMVVQMSLGRSVGGHSVKVPGL
jgi:hypothetical protein